MKYITVELLKKMNACQLGIDEFCNELNKRNLEQVSVDQCIQTAVEIGSEYVMWLFDNFGKYLTDGFTCDWSKFDGLDWRCLLMSQPQFSIHCDWNKLNGHHWRCLLRNQPQFHEYCDWSKLGGYNWSDLLTDRPQFHEHCDWTKLSGYNWSCLLTHQPQFEKHKPVD